MNLAITALAKRAFQVPRGRVPARKVLELVAPNPVVEVLDGTGWDVRGCYRDRDLVPVRGEVLASQYRVASVFIPFRAFRTDGEAVDYVVHYLDLLVAKLLPPPKPPKGWRLFSRRRP